MQNYLARRDLSKYICSLIKFSRNELISLVFTYRIFDANHIPHGKKVVMHFMREKGGLLEFEKMWRRQFIETMEPKYLPNLWSVDHKPERMEHISELTI